MKNFLFLFLLLLSGFAQASYPLDPPTNASEYCCSLNQNPNAVRWYTFASQPYFNKELMDPDSPSSPITCTYKKKSEFIGLICNFSPKAGCENDNINSLESSDAVDVFKKWKSEPSVDIVCKYINARIIYTHDFTNNNTYSERARQARADFEGIKEQYSKDRTITGELEKIDKAVDHLLESNPTPLNKTYSLYQDYWEINEERSYNKIYPELIKITFSVDSEIPVATSTNPYFHVRNFALYYPSRFFWN